MRVNLPPTIFETFPRVVRTSTIPGLFQSRQTMAQSTSTTSSATPPDFSAYGIQTTTIPTAPGVSLSPTQQLATGSVLDLFAGLPSKRKLMLWTDDAVFADPLTIAQGRKQFEAQWYGLRAVFSEIERLHCEVRSAGNPIELDLKTRYQMKGLGSEKTIASKVLIHLDSQGEKIVKVEDKWDGKIPEGAFSKAMRNLNSVTVPVLVSVPNSVEEEEAAQKK